MIYDYNENMFVDLTPLRVMTRYEFCNCGEPRIVSWFNSFTISTGNTDLLKLCNNTNLIRFCPAEICPCLDRIECFRSHPNNIEKVSHYRDMLFYIRKEDLL